MEIMNMMSRIFNFLAAAILVGAGCTTTSPTDYYKVTGVLLSPDGLYEAEYGTVTSYCDCGTPSTSHWAVVASRTITNKSGGTTRTIKFSEKIKTNPWAQAADGKPEEYIKWAEDSKSVTFYIAPAPFTVHIEKLRPIPK